MIRHTTWKPDTCTCEIVLAWDDSIPSPDHTLEHIDHKCQIHSTSSDKDVLEKVFEEKIKLSLNYKKISQH